MGRQELLDSQETRPGNCLDCPFHRAFPDRWADSTDPTPYGEYKERAVVCLQLKKDRNAAEQYPIVPDSKTTPSQIHPNRVLAEFLVDQLPGKVIVPVEDCPLPIAESRN